MSWLRVVTLGLVGAALAGIGASASFEGHASAAAPRLTVEGQRFLLDGRPFVIRSGEMHYPRVPRAYWRDRMRRLRALGLNTLTTSVFWNVHEREAGAFHFSGDLDVATYVRTAQEEGLRVILRPGPYVCTEWDLGGLSSRLLRIRLNGSGETPRARRPQPGEEDALLQHANPHLRGLIGAALSTGCRLGDLLGLRLRDLRLNPKSEPVAFQLPADKTRTATGRVVHDVRDFLGPCEADDDVTLLGVQRSQAGPGPRRPGRAAEGRPTGGPAPERGPSRDGRSARKHGRRGDFRPPHSNTVRANG